MAYTTTILALVLTTIIGLITTNHRENTCIIGLNPRTHMGGTRKDRLNYGDTLPWATDGNTNSICRSSGSTSYDYCVTWVGYDRAHSLCLLWVNGIGANRRHMWCSMCVMLDGCQRQRLWMNQRNLGVRHNTKVNDDRELSSS